MNLFPLAVIIALVFIVGFAFGRWKTPKRRPTESEMERKTALDRAFAQLSQLESKEERQKALDRAFSLGYHTGLFSPERRHGNDSNC